MTRSASVFALIHWIKKKTKKKYISNLDFVFAALLRYAWCHTDIFKSAAHTAENWFLNVVFFTWMHSGQSHADNLFKPAVYTVAFSCLNSVFVMLLHYAQSRTKIWREASALQNGLFSILFSRFCCTTRGPTLTSSRLQSTLQNIDVLIVSSLHGCAPGSPSLTKTAIHTAEFWCLNSVFVTLLR